MGRRLRLPVAKGRPPLIVRLDRDLPYPPGRRHNQRTRAWRIGHLLRALRGKAEQAGITIRLADERGTSSTCPRCHKPVPRPAGRVFTCPHCKLTGHRDLLAAANIAARAGGGTTPATLPADVTHRRAGTHLPGAHPARRDPRRRAHHRRARGSPGRPRPAPTRPSRAGRGVARPDGEEPGIHPSIYRQVH
ncbi:MAG TPA: zinc ribbon domain-containing protein [Streptosporangiaceae bacterium]|nr:zinc ribbon domain-containing protein [Streptosporangiaceae bacterium]